jgi:release factor glutamine methyltransferase
METLGSLVTEAADSLSAAGFEQARRHARRLIASVLAVPPAELFGHPDRPVDRSQLEVVRTMLSRILRREPLSRILKRREFWGLDFALSPETLDPRPETETVVEAVTKRYCDRRAPLRILDLGTGTGCLLLALLSEFPDGRGIGIDISEGAVRTAASNAASLGFSDRAAFFVGNWAAAVSGAFEAIVANPPYIPSGDLGLLPAEVICYDPWRALDGGPDGLQAYSALVRDAAKLLAPQGIFATEVGAGQADAVAGLVEESCLSFEGIERDLAGITRCVIARARPAAIIETKNDWNAVRSRLGWQSSGAGAAAQDGKISWICPDRGQGDAPAGQRSDNVHRD